MHSIRTPWRNRKEWEHVAQLVISRDMTALDYLAVWGSRVSRLPAGVETTLSLLEVVNSLDSTLALATAINRFLNHISHIGMNVWGLGKLHDAAAVLEVPEWLVEIRHDSTHGTMPSNTLLRAGHELCYTWICTNYWSKPLATSTTDNHLDTPPPQAVLSRLLECHMYLKTYQIWGVERVGEVETEQEEVYNHIRELWPRIETENLSKLTIKQALGIVKTEILNLADSGDDTTTTEQMMAEVLVTDDLLVPEPDFLQSLLPPSGHDDDEDDDNVEVPPHLVTIWADYIVRIDEHLGAKVVIDRLVDRISSSSSGNGDGDSVSETAKEYMAAWVVLLSEALLGRPSAAEAGLNLNNNNRLQMAGGGGSDSRTNGLMTSTAKQSSAVARCCGMADVERWVSRPNRLIQMLVPCFCNLAGIGAKQRNLLKAVVGLAVGEELENGVVVSQANGGGGKKKTSGPAAAAAAAVVQKIFRLEDVTGLKEDDYGKKKNGRCNGVPNSLETPQDSSADIFWELCTADTLSACCHPERQDGWQDLWLDPATVWQEPMAAADSGRPEECDKSIVADFSLPRVVWPTASPAKRQLQHRGGGGGGGRKGGSNSDGGHCHDNGRRVAGGKLQQQEDAVPAFYRNEAVTSAPRGNRPGGRYKKFKTS